MRRSRRIGLTLLFCAGPVGTQQESDVTRLARDPDRGLEAGLRARLALVDAQKDTWAVERWAALIDARLAVVAELWRENRIAEVLPGESWIAPDLRVRPLFAEATESARVRGEWSVHRETSAASGATETSLTSALAAWRAVFPGEARLDLEVFAIEGDAPEVESRVRVTASGPLAAARLQHDAEWRCRWRFLPSAVEGSAGGSTLEPDAVELIGLRVERFESVRLAGHPQGLFEDVTESVLGEALFREQVAPGLDHWRECLPAALEPGSLGHHGLALADVDGDGLEDLYWCRPGGLPNKLLLHTSDAGVRDASSEAGVDLLDYSSSALLVDLDGDADADLAVATGSSLVFFANDGRARFEQALRSERSLATSLAAADADADGDLDLYVCSYVSPYEKSGMPVPYHDAENGEANALLRNDGEWNLVDATAALGLDANNRRFSLAAAWEDYDNDGDPDLYVANDFGRNNLYRNDGGRFRDVAAELGALDIAAGMGVAWADVDDDGWMDLYVTNLYSPAGSRLTARPGARPGSDAGAAQAFRHHAQGNTLLLNGKGGAFRDVSAPSGTARGRWGWGSIFLDLDNDGALDLFAPNGFVSNEHGSDLDSFFWRQVVLQSPEGAGEPGETYGQGWRAVNRLVRQGISWNGHERNVALLALGRAEFADVSSLTGLDLADDARAAARVDWDGDGDEDLIVANRTAPMLRFLRNQQASGQHWIAFALQGEGKRSPIGARVELETSSGRRSIRTLRCGEGFLAQSSARVHFGLGGDGVRRVTVRWPGAEPEEFGSPTTDALYVLEQGTGRARALPAREASARLRQHAPEIPASSGSSRTVLPTPLPLPRLVLETWDGQAASVLGISMQGPRGTGQPLFLLVWSSSAPSSRRELERLATATESLSGAGLQVLALSADAGAERERSRSQLAEIAWPFARGFASEEALQILELVQGTLHDDARSLALPCGFLVDPGGRLIATYQGKLDPERLRKDLELIDLLSEARRDACVPFTGRWVAALPPSPAEKVAARLDAHGLERAAAEYRLAQVEVHTLSAARLRYEQGVSAHRQGRLAEAIAYYQQALESDPGYALAAQDLAVALHQKGELGPALAAYKQALKLDPGHALTRCNLGYLYLGQGDVESAKKELAALRALQSELAATLAERIQEFERR